MANANRKVLADMIDAVATAVIAAADELTVLDQAIGDGDHGINMTRGFTAVRDEKAAIAEMEWPDALKKIGMTLVMKVGGASGPLYGTLFMEFGKAWPAEPDSGSLAAAFDQAIAGVMRRGKSEAGQKTMLDVLVPVQAALAEGNTDLTSVADAAAAATIPLQAIRGRASFLGERSIGHMDPGARSSALIVGAICATMHQEVGHG